MSKQKNGIQPDQPEVRSLIGERLSLAAFQQFSGNLAGYPFVKLVVERSNKRIHFINNAIYQFHADYLADNLLGIRPAVLDQKIDHYNKIFYSDAERPYLLGILALHTRSEGVQATEDRSFFSLETVEVDTMSLEMLKELFQVVKDHLDPSIPLLLKPANHYQETVLEKVDVVEMPRIYSHELFKSARFVALNKGKAHGRLRAFRSEAEYNSERFTIEWHDIVVMARVPDDIPRIAGIINTHHTTPLSHTNVLASGWQIPNCTQLGILEKIEKEKLNGEWVEYIVENDATEVSLKKLERPKDLPPPAWGMTKIQLETPETHRTPILTLNELRMTDRFRYGTKAANLGELHYLLANGSPRILGYYKVKRPPRANLLPYLAKLLNVPETANLEKAAWDFLCNFTKLPNGIAIPFAVQQQFLESSPQIQQAIGKLKMALELNARQIDALCVTLQKMIVATKIPKHLMDYIDGEITRHLSGVSSFVIRSSSNAEDLENFSAAGIYESLNHVTSADKIFESIKQVWASTLSPRSVRLRQEVGIPLDDVYMGVIIQEEIQADMGGVMVTTNPANRGDFRNVYINTSSTSVVQVVQGTELPYQYLYNTVEGGGRTVSLGSSKEDLSSDQKKILQQLSLAGRLLQSHFSPDYTFSAPVDIEWLANGEGVHLLQLRPFAK
ncbi:MAG: PEP/pyruvate-binding domain-containing protein [Bdellovibrionota bacterium]